MDICCLACYTKGFRNALLHMQEVTKYTPDQSILLERIEYALKLMDHMILKDNKDCNIKTIDESVNTK